MMICEEAERLQHECYANAADKQARDVAFVESREKHVACMNSWQAGFGYAMGCMRNALDAQASAKKGA